MRFLTDRKRAEGNGSARSGTEHHWHMMVLSMALVVVVPAFVLTFGSALGGSREEVLAFFARPFPALVMAVTLVVLILHLTSEVVEAVEDYVHGIAGKLTLVGVNAASYILMGVGLFAIAKLAL
ncbi:succinate dehydrogenase, hydrophobic membrane anchor protein [Poseidonocella sedimentorum]|uniref:Succinate dehydrogenase subunit D n=1 Tax=Poseidonocella sedimentorum TaxID=871652 RepID=A0A1I6DRS2_9RHOB|nr:succinate dehydrogenase, hydrophobic membrane anchor protein [Poseidonocella sedimentorum]SFR08149.1 succinate dehydrogenase subunit D [Poseidonocella sedimentorum]